MPASQQHITPQTPTGTNLIGEGATFRLWAPAAKEVHVITDKLAAARSPGWVAKEKN
jgi:1,4-alpha-glucan branching enzyme